MNLDGLAVMEFKDTAYAPLEQMGQAFVSGVNIILSHPSSARIELVWVCGSFDID